MKTLSSRNVTGNCLISVDCRFPFIDTGSTLITLLSIVHDFLLLSVEGRSETNSSQVQRRYLSPSLFTNVFILR